MCRTMCKTCGKMASIPQNSKILIFFKKVVDFCFFVKYTMQAVADETKRSTQTGQHSANDNSLKGSKKDLKKIEKVVDKDLSL